MNVTKEEAVSVLFVLESMKHCLDNDITYSTVKGKSFNLTRQHGICWHVYAHTPVQSIDSNYLQPIFVEMGLDPNYPVELQMVDSTEEAKTLHWQQRNLCVMDSEPGKVRYKLICDLIKYFSKVLDTAETV